MADTDVPVVVGADAIGLSAVAALARRGISPIIVIVANYNDAPLELAKTFGAHITVSYEHRHRQRLPAVDSTWTSSPGRSTLPPAAAKSDTGRLPTIMCLTAVGDRRVRRRLTKQQAVKADVEFRHAGQNLLCDLFPLVELPGVELGAEITLNWAYVAFGDVKRRERTRSNLPLRGEC